jgi:hypothetical protein
MKAPHEVAAVCSGHGETILAREQSVDDLDGVETLPRRALHRRCIASWLDPFKMGVLREAAI